MILEGIERVLIGRVERLLYGTMRYTFIDDDITVHRPRISEVVEDIAGLHRCWAWSHVSRKVPRRVVAMFHGKFREWWSPFFVEGYEKGG